MKTLYLCGPISNDPDYKRKFDLAQRVLGKYYFVMNPAGMDIPPEKKYWHKAMRRALQMMLDCDGIALLDDWHKSEGATIEHNIASRLSIPAKSVNDWIVEAVYDEVNKKDVKK